MSRVVGAVAALTAAGEPPAGSRLKLPSGVLITSACACAYDIVDMISNPFITAGHWNSVSDTGCPSASAPSRRHVGAAEAWQWRHAPGCGFFSTRSVCSWSASM
jgi:hypothetical protein